MNEDKKMFLQDLVVVKRSGQRVGFNAMKIAIVIKKAFDSLGIDNSENDINLVYEDVLKFIKEKYFDRKTINVEDIQDIIEAKLQENKFQEVYSCFNDYRMRRAASRKAFDIKQQHKFVRAIERIVDDNKKNTDNKPSDILLDFGKTISCEYNKAYVLDNKFVRAHDDGTIYIHNLDYFSLGSLSSTHLIFDKVVTDEFPLKLLCMALNAKNEIDGEITISKLDYLLMPLFLKRFKEKFKEKLNRYLDVLGYLEYLNFKKIEDLIDKEDTINFEFNIFDQFILNDRVKDIFELAYNDSVKKMEELITISFERLLTSLNENRQENKKYTISLGTNDSIEGLMINNCYLNVLLQIPYLENVTTIFKIKNDSNTELLSKASNLVVLQKNIAFANVEASYNKDLNNEVEYFSNGKRIFENVFSDEKNSIGRMIVSSVSINMGRLGLKYCAKNMDDFYLELDDILDLTKNILVMIFETIGNKSKENYEIIFNGNILEDDKLDANQKVRKVIKKGVLNIELASLYECVISLETNVKRQKEIIKDIVRHVKDKAKQYSLETKLNFVVSETSKSRPLKKLIAFDKAIYGIKKGITDKKSYLRIDSLFEFDENINNDFKYIGEYQKELTGGNLVIVDLPKNITFQKIIDLLKLVIKNDVGFIKFNIRK